jgi:hypothetical protein
MGAAVQQGLEVGDAGVDPDDLCRSLGEQVIPEAPAPVHLDEQPAEVAQHVFARLEEGAALTAKHARVRPSQRETLVGSAAAEERGHHARV